MKCMVAYCSFHQTTMIVWIIAPTTVHSFHKMCKSISAAAALQELTTESQGSRVFYLHLKRSRGFWRELYPCLFFSGYSSHPQTRRKMILSLFSTYDELSIRRLNNKGSNRETLELLKFIVTPEHSKTEFNIRKVNLGGRYAQVPGNPTSSQKVIALLLLYPTTETTLEYGWEERLVHWEHQLILAQSLAGFYSTLGGGFFMTRHFKTALQLSTQQQRMALFMGDQEMFWKCQINQAYDLIRCGYLAHAKRFIHNVQHQELQQNKNRNGTDHSSTTLQNMCKSALLFLKRVRKTALQDKKTKAGSHPSLVVDDFNRIRILMDQSSKDDFFLKMSNQ